MKNKSIKLLILLSIILIMTGTILNIKDNIKSEIPEKYKNIKYRLTKIDDCSCIEFTEKYNFKEYDCESNGSFLPYSGEFYNTYKYISKRNMLILNGEDVKPVYVDILEWSDDKLKLKVQGYKEKNNCSVNNNNIFEYFVDSIETKGKEIKDKITEFSKNNITISYWGQFGKKACTSKDDKDCKSNDLITIEEILSKINNNKYYTLSYKRDNKGNVISANVAWLSTNND